MLITVGNILNNEHMNSKYRLAIIIMESHSGALNQ